ncbi:MAG: hypothetical protein HOZ81_10880 [Streptomyces sp.]|nr:hypothetical protein [Streptomyces sp.]NUS24245.1 hypothetical protein [Streptomyces sp.]
MTGLEWLLWLASVWAVFFLFALFDVPILLERAANRLRRQHLPHWARHGHAPPTDAVPHGRHAKTTQGGSA